MMNPSHTLREIAALAPNEDIKAKLDMLAAQFETQHNQQNNQWSVVIGQLENHLLDRIAALRWDLEQDVGNTEARLQAIMDLFDTLHSEVRALQRAKARGDDADGNE